MTEEKTDMRDMFKNCEISKIPPLDEQKMSDGEIMKAIEICAQNSVTRHNGLTYQGLPLHFLFEEILGFVNRQKAEIERLNHIVDVNKMVKTEAVKEFAERLKVEMEDKKYKYITYTDYSKTVNAVIDDCIGATDDLIEEFTEGE